MACTRPGDRLPAILVAKKEREEIEEIQKTIQKKIDEKEGSMEAYPNCGADKAPAPVKEDNWEHRSTGMRCRTCMFYVPKQVIACPRKDYFGRCRRHAPTMAGWPAVYWNDWCGDHKMDENKVV